MTLLSDSVTSRIDTINVITNQSIPTTQTVISGIVNGGAVKNVKVNWRVAGATCVGKLQGSMDGTNWYDIQTLASGINAVVATQDPYLRVTVLNNNGASQTNEVWATFQI